ncbi:MAG: LamG domain-containing protein, partial [Candidatus Dojkabacteria bacterium]|nr:LamG domain-containing protein [Candidatus Dojkabacteria bacterium]
VGAGAGTTSSGKYQGANGSNSVFSTITATGGGGGGYGDSTMAYGTGGSAGGCGGGGGGGTSGGGGGGAGSQGYNGEGGAYYLTGGGGGGGGEAGGTDGAAYGGDGYSSSISGAATYYSGGGGGGRTGGPGGDGGGGAGGGGYAGGTAGTANTGGGGGGAAWNGTGGAGGSGIVIVRYVYYDNNYDLTESETITSTDISSYNKISFWLSGDSLGHVADIIYGESAYANYEPDANTVGLWHMNEEINDSCDAFEDVCDASTSGYDGTATGTTISSSGYIGNGRSLNGTASDYITFSGLTWTPTTFTVDWWLYPSACSNYNQQLSATNGWGAFFFAADSTCAIYVGTDVTLRFTPTELPANSVVLSKWQHFAYTYDGTQGRFYKNGVLIAGPKTQTTPTAWGGFTVGINSTNSVNGLIDEVRVSNVARSATDIRQAYEVGSRTHPVNVSFKADLQSGNLITGSSDKSFTISETDYGTTDDIENLNIGDRIVVTESTYKAQGTVDSANTGTGAVTVSSWDTGSTFPSGGYTVSAEVFKWQKEYIDIRNNLSSFLDGITTLTFRKINYNHQVYVDDFNAVEYSSDYTGSSFTPVEDIQYVQYRAIFSTWDSDVTPYISAVQLDYEEGGPTLDLLMRHGKWFNSSGVRQPFWYVGN